MPIRRTMPISGTVTNYPGSWNGSVFVPIVSNFSRAFTMSENLVMSNGSGDHVTPNPFLQRRSYVIGALFNGKRGSSASSYDEYINRDDRLYDSYESVFTNTVEAGLANRLFANTTPDRADVLLPAFVFEIADVPRALYHAGRKLLKGRQPPPKFPRKPGANQAAADWVALNFGWLPMIGDLKKLAEFSDLAAKRNKEFDRLYSGSGLLRRMNLDSSSRAVSISYSSRIPFSEALTAKGYCNQKIWGTVRWRPAGYGTGSTKPRPTPDYVKRAVLGLNAANITSNVWEALPWSWFIDYFLGVQDMLIANGGFTRTAVPGIASIMVNSKTVLTSPARSLPPDSLNRTVHRSEGVHFSEVKQRATALPGFISARFPDLSVKQLSILGALAVLKRPR